MKWLIPCLARLLLTVVGKTIRLQEVDFDVVSKWLARPHLPDLPAQRSGGSTQQAGGQAGQPVIFAFWHNRIFYLTYYLTQRFIRRGHKLVVLSSLSRDGEIMARLETKLGATVIRGSSSRRAQQGLLELCRLVRPDKNSQPTGYSPVLTVDGPRGPKYHIQPGIVFIAQRTSLPIIPISYQSNHCYVFNSWDNFIVPLPFSRVKVCYGKPILAQKGITQEETARLKHRLKEELLRTGGEPIKD